MKTILVILYLDSITEKECSSLIMGSSMRGSLKKAGSKAKANGHGQVARFTKGNSLKTYLKD